MDNNFYSEEHKRDAFGNVIVEPTGNTIAKMRERHRSTNFINGVIMSCLALSVILTGAALGATGRRANDLQNQLESAQQQNAELNRQVSSYQTSYTSPYSSTESNGTAANNGTSTNGGTSASSYGTNGDASSMSSYGLTFPSSSTTDTNMDGGDVYNTPSLPTSSDISDMSVRERTRRGRRWRNSRYNGTYNNGN
ncbi:MAG: hypothetical protein LBH47_02020 [Christensenellaceae bacterium]|nr:hypothetical protein [Christensenellaceae bacterium]